MIERNTEEKRGRSRRPRWLRISPATVIATIALVVAATGVAQSAVPGPDGRINACYLIDPDPDFSYVYLINETDSCLSGETKIDWTQTPADEQLAVSARKALDALGNIKLPEALAGVNKAFKNVDGSVPKAKLDKKDILKPFKGKEGKGLAQLLKDVKKNDRAQARFNKNVRAMMETLANHTDKATQASSGIGSTTGKLLQALGY